MLLISQGKILLLLLKENKKKDTAATSDRLSYDTCSCTKRITIEPARAKNQRINKEEIINKQISHRQINELPPGITE
jgi:hypothetical protein